MSKEKNLFFPIFYNALEICASLSDEEFGKLIRALLASGGKKDYVPQYSPHLLIAYKFMLDSAIRVFGSGSGLSEKDRVKKRSPRELTPEEEEYAEEAFKRAVERSLSH